MIYNPPLEKVPPKPKPTFTIYYDRVYLLDLVQPFSTVAKVANILS
jgi:hypothetical protein